MKRFGLLLAALLLLLAGCSAAEDSQTAAQTVARINGESITQQELDYYEKALRAQVMSEVIGEYSAVYSEDFWSTEYGGTTPNEKLRSLAIEKCCESKLQLILCRDNGIYDDISYAALLGKANAYNSANEGKSGVVGLTEIDIDTFYTYYIDTGVMELKNILEGGILAPTDEEIAEYIGNMSESDTAQFDDETLRAHAKDVLVNEKYTELIKKLRREADIETVTTQ